MKEDFKLYQNAWLLFQENNFIVIKVLKINFKAQQWK